MNRKVIAVGASPFFRRIIIINSFLYNLVMDTYTFGYNSSSFVDMPISHKVFMAQFDTIQNGKNAIYRKPEH